MKPGLHKPPFGTATPDSSSSLQRGLRAHYMFNERGGTILYDHPGYGYRGTLTNMTPSTDWVARPDGLALDFDGSNDFVQINGHLGSPQNVTLAAWCNLDLADINGSDIISFGDALLIRADDSAFNLRGVFYDGTSFRPTNSSENIAGTGLRHVVYTADMTNGSQKLYLDSVEIGSSTHTGSISYSFGANTFIGAHGSGSNNFDFDGLIYDVRVYDRALTEREVFRLFETPYGDYLPPAPPRGLVMAASGADLSGTATLAALGAVTGTGAVSYTLAPNYELSGTANLPGLADVTGTGTATGPGTYSLTGTASLAALGAVTGTGSASYTQPASVDLSGTGTLALLAAVTSTGSVTEGASTAGGGTFQQVYRRRRR